MVQPFIAMELLEGILPSLSANELDVFKKLGKGLLSECAIKREVA